MKQISISKLNAFFANLDHLLKTKWVKRFITYLILIDIAAALLNTYEEFNLYKNWFSSITAISAVFFTVEYFCRILSAKTHYSNLSAFQARKKYIFSFYGIIDFICVLPFIISYFATTQEIAEAVNFARIFLILKLARYSLSFQLFGNIFKKVKREMIIVGIAGSFIVGFCAFLMYYIERDAQPDKFSNVGDSIWWAVITFATVGYGDIYPITPLGRFLGMFMAIIGLITIAVPASIFTSNFMASLQEKKAAPSSKLPSSTVLDSTKENDFFICPHCGKKIKYAKKEND
ncbi:MAG: ion transporter [Bacteroidales bacterium]